MSKTFLFQAIQFSQTVLIQTIQFSISTKFNCQKYFSFKQFRFVKQFEIDLVGRVFANGPGDFGSIPGCVTPKTLKMVLDTSLLNTQQYKVRIKSKVSNPGKGVAPSPIPRCCSYWKGSLLVALDYGRQLYYFFIYYYFIHNFSSEH